MLYIIKDKRFLVLFLIIFIVILISLIYFLGNNVSQNSNHTLKGFDNLKSQAKNLSSSPDINEEPNYQKLINQLAQLENNKLSKKEQIDIAGIVSSYIIGTYYSTRNNKVYKFAIYYKEFIKVNFGDELKFDPPCYDPKCADSPQPQEIISITNEIRDSDLPQGAKDTVISDLIRYGYLKDGYGLPEYDIKIGNYVSEANMIKNDPDFIKAELNQKIYDEIITFLKSTYPKSYSEFIKR